MIESCLQVILNDLSAVSDSSLVKGKSNHRTVPLGNATCNKMNICTLCVFVFVCVCVFVFVCVCVCVCACARVKRILCMHVNTATTQTNLHCSTKAFNIRWSPVQ